MMTFDTLANFVSGLGMWGKDKATASTFVFRDMSAREIVDAYRGDWIAANIVDIPAFDMTRAWRTFQGDKDQIGLIENEEKRLGIREKVNKAIIYSRLFGGGALILDDGGPDLMAALDVKTRGGLRQVVVVPKHRCTAGDLQWDPGDEGFDLPRWFNLSGGQRGSVEVHPSRVITFGGNLIPDVETAGDANSRVYGDSVLVRVRDAVAGAAATNNAIAALVEEAKVDVVTVGNLTATMTNKELRDRYTERWNLAAVSKAITKVLMLDGGNGTPNSGEKYEQKNQTFTGLPEIAMTMLQIVSAAAKMPATKFLSQSPAGMNSTGESDHQNYDMMIMAEQDVFLRPRLDRLDDVLIISATGKPRPDGLYSRFNPLRSASPKEQADIRKAEAEAITAYVGTNLIPVAALEAAVQNKLIEDGWLPGIEQAIEEAKQGILTPFEEGDPEDDPENDPAVPDPSASLPAPNQEPEV